MAAEKDPYTAERLKLFQDFCEKKGWKDENDRWLVAEASEFFKRKPNQISNYLRGNTKTFGSRVASSMARDAGLTSDIFEPNPQKSSMSSVAYQLGRTFDSFGFDEATETEAFNAAVAALVRYLKPKNAT